MTSSQTTWLRGTTRWRLHMHLRLERGIESGLSLVGNHRMNTTRHLLTFLLQSALLPDIMHLSGGYLRFLPMEFFLPFAHRTNDRSRRFKPLTHDMLHSATSLASYGRKTWRIIAAWRITRSDGSGTLRFEGEFIWNLFLLPGLPRLSTFISDPAWCWGLYWAHE